MAFTFNDVGGKIVIDSWGRFQTKVSEAVVVGDLLNRLASEATDAYQLADESGGERADAVACQNGADGDTIWCALGVVLKAPSVPIVGGEVTQQYFMGTPSTDYVGSPLYLHEEGKVDETAGSEAIVQPVGVILSTDRILLTPGMPGMFVAAASHIADPTNDSTGTADAIDSILIVLENLGFVKMA